MILDVTQLAIPDIKVLTTKKYGDHRGFFSETYNQKGFAEAGIDISFVQDNHSLSAEAGTLRGLHYQGGAFAQDKLVRVLKGAILDVAVDLRRSSSTFGQWVSAEISEEKWNQILVPKGFAHGIVTLEPNTELLYKVSNFYAPDYDYGIRWNDPKLSIDWPFSEEQIILSEKDKEQPFFENAQFVFE